MSKVKIILERWRVSFFFKPGNVNLLMLSQSCFVTYCGQTSFLLWSVKLLCTKYFPSLTAGGLRRIFSYYIIIVLFGFSLLLNYLRFCSSSEYFTTSLRKAIASSQFSCFSRDYFWRNGCLPSFVDFDRFSKLFSQ